MINKSTLELRVIFWPSSFKYLFNNLYILFRHAIPIEISARYSLKRHLYIKREMHRVLKSDIYTD